jgi:hypothetical protein
LLGACLGGSLLVDLIEDLGCKAELGNDVFLLRIAEEGVGLGRNIKAIIGLYVAPIVLNVQTVVLNRMSLNAIGLSTILALKNKAFLGIVRNGCRTEMLKLPAARLGIDVDLIEKGIFAPFDLGANLLALPQESIGHVRKFGFSLVGF